MGSKYRLLTWIHDIVQGLKFDTVLDGFSGSGVVGYLFKTMGKRVISNDFLKFSHHIANALVANNHHVITGADMDLLLKNNPSRKDFISEKFEGIFFGPEDNQFLDNTWSNLKKLDSEEKVSLALTALFLSCLRRQPRGVFTISGIDGRYDDGRQDLRMSLEEHFIRAVAGQKRVIFDNGKSNFSLNQSIYDVDPAGIDLVYLDPPYIPRSDDNCYIKRYHFLEGLATYWNGVTIIESSKVKKIQKRYTPFSYRKQAQEAFENLFARFRNSIIVLSYSSNGYPSLDELMAWMKKAKSTVTVHENDHRYHFGTHSQVDSSRVLVKEYLIVGI